MGIAEEVLIFLNVKNMPALKDVQKAMIRLGYNLRLAGRDMMRMAGSLRNTSRFFMSFAGRVFSSSDIIQDAFGDIRYALEDIMEATGILDFIADVLELIARVVEDHPILAWLMIISFGVGVLMLFLSKVLMFLGFMRLLVGAVLSARTANLSLIDSIKWIIAVMTGETESIKRNVEQQTLDLAIRKRRIAVMQEQAKWQTAVGRWNKRALREEKKRGRGLKGLVSAGLKTAASFGLLALALMAIQPLMEALAPIFEAAGEVISEMISPLEPLIEAIAQWIEENPELAMTFFGVIAGILGLLVYLPKLLTAFKGGIDILTKIIDKIPTLSEAFTTLKGNISTFLSTVKEKFVAWKDKVIESLSGVKDAFIRLGSTIKEKITTAASTVFSFFKSLISKIGEKVVPALVFLKGHISSLALGIGAAVGAFLVIDSLLRALPAELRAPVGAIVALIAAIGAATVAWMAFHGTMTVGTAIPIILAAVAAGIAGVKAMAGFQNLRRPVEIVEPTLAVLHPGEEVHPRRRRVSTYRPKEPPLTVTVDVTGAGSMEEIIQRAVEASYAQISEQMERKYRRSEY